MVPSRVDLEDPSQKGCPDLVFGCLLRRGVYLISWILSGVRRVSSLSRGFYVDDREGISTLSRVFILGDPPPQFSGVSY